MIFDDLTSAIVSGFVFMSTSKLSVHRLKVFAGAQRCVYVCVRARTHASECTRQAYIPLPLTVHRHKATQPTRYMYIVCQYVRGIPTHHRDVHVYVHMILVHPVRLWDSKHCPIAAKLHDIIIIP